MTDETVDRPAPDLDELHTAEEIAAYFKVDPKTILNWAKDGSIPEALRIGRVVRFNLADVKSSLNMALGAEGRHMELTVLALNMVCPGMCRMTRMDPGSVTLDEIKELRRYCEAYLEALDGLVSSEEKVRFCEGVIEAARVSGKEPSAGLDDIRAFRDQLREITSPPFSNADELPWIYSKTDN